MRRIWVNLALCVVFLSCTAAPAQAQLWRWIYELSGPGPFDGLEFEWRLVCLSEPDPTRPAPRPGPEPTGRERAARVLGVVAPGCLFRPVPLDQRRRASFNLAAGLFEARRNNLTYASSSTNREVKLTSIEPTFWWRPVDSIEIGVGAGILWFSGPAFESFSRGFFEPVRIDVKPLALASELIARGHPEWTEVLSVRAGAIVTPHGFSAEDFGAVPGTFQTSREVLRTFAVFIDLEPVARHLRRPRAGTTGQRP